MSVLEQYPHRGYISYQKLKWMNRGNKTGSWNDKLDLEVLWCRNPKEWFKLKHSPFCKEIHKKWSDTEISMPQ